MIFLGNKKALNSLEQLLTEEKRPLTYILCGPEHVGKRLAATLFLQALINSDKKLGQEFLEKMHPDLRLISEPKEISADEVRNIRAFLSHSPLAGPIKGILIDNAHLLGTIGSNILLKSIEEPPHQTYTIFVTSRPDLIPRTIFSRSTKVTFTSVSNTILVSSLTKLQKTKLVKELDWICGRPGLMYDYLSNPEKSHVKTLKKYFHGTKGDSVTSCLKRAEEISKVENPHYALEGILLSLRSVSKTNSPKKIKALIHTCNQIQYTNANARLSIERALLS